MSVKYPNYVNLASSSEEQPNERTPLPPPRKLADKQSSRPSGSLPSNTQSNQKGHNSKTYQSPQAQNEHVNVVFKRNVKSYNPPVNSNDQQNNSENTINFDSDEQDEEPTPQPKTQNPKPVKETPLPKPYKPKIPCPQHLRKEKMEARIDVNDEILDEDFDALFDEGSKILHSIEGTFLEEEIFVEFDEFMAITADKNSDSQSDIEDPLLKKITINTDYNIKTSLEEPPTDIKLKPLLDNLEYVFLEKLSFLPVIISCQLSKEKKNKLVSILKKHKKDFAWKTTDILGICPSFCKHKIQLLDDKKPVVQKQRRLNPNMQEVVKKEIVKLLNTGIIYPIADSPWVSPIHFVAKKGGNTVVTNENDELVSTRTVTSWRVCIDYRKLNEATAKDHFPSPFMDQMLERLVHVGNLSRYDRRISRRIVLGHKVSSEGLEFGKAKIDVISKLPPLLIIKVLEAFSDSNASIAQLLGALCKEEYTPKGNT
nr:reverse transcriptase domain-containing protein [Tanacetum cinerariifolium]